MERILDKVNGGRVELEYFADDISSHYILAGERFRHEHELLKLITKYDGACTEDNSAHSLTTNCDFDCMNCSKSIYHIIKTQERFFENRCLELCRRNPKVGDEWEVSLVSYDGIMPRYQDYYFRCAEAIHSKAIIELAYDVVKERYPKFYAQSKYCYVKIRRFDLDQATDVSLVANQFFQGFLDDTPYDQIRITRI